MEKPYLVNLINNFVAESYLNTVQELDDLQIFNRPLVGIAQADDPLFWKLQQQEVVGPNHLLPRDWLGEAKSVVSYFLPFSARVREANYIEELPATEWLYGRIEGEDLNDALRRYLCDEIQKAGGKAVAPVIDSRFAVIDRRSNWSERHIAFISGLGTFNLSKSLITSKGCAGRYGSIVTDITFPVTKREYQQIDEYCDKCFSCIDRCPVGAISEIGKDHEICSRYLDAMRERFEPRYGCGKCQTAVPCEKGIPGIK